MQKLTQSMDSDPISAFVCASHSNHNVRARLHQASSSTLRQLCDDASDTVLIENNGVAQEQYYSVISELSQRWRWCLV